MRQIITTGTATLRHTVTGPVFLLIGRADRVGQANTMNLNPADDSLGANWQYADSFWVAIDPFMGVPKSAECFASGTSVVDSQRWIRQALFSEGN